MTQALCFHCGRIKFGVLLPCKACGKLSSGNMDLDMKFSDHNLRLGSLEGLGQVIAEIHKVCPHETLRFYAFWRYMETRHPDYVKVTLSRYRVGELDEILREAKPPFVTLVPKSRVGWT